MLSSPEAGLGLTAILSQPPNAGLQVRTRIPSPLSTFKHLPVVLSHLLPALEVSSPPWQKCRAKSSMRWRPAMSHRGTDS